MPIDGSMFDLDQLPCATSSRRRAPTSTSRSRRRPLIRLHGELEPIPGTEPLTPGGHRAASARDARRPGRSSSEFDDGARGRLLLRDRGPRPLPRQRLPPARLDLARLRAIPVDDQARSRSSTCPTVITRARRGGARHHPAHRHDRLRQVDDARGDDRPHQPDACASTSSRSRTRSSSCTATSSSIINQREVGMDTASFKRALRRVLRQDPDVILDRRDARRGDGPAPRCPRPRPATSCSRRCTPSTRPRSINRIIDFFPPHQQQQARAMIAGTLKGIDLPAPRAAPPTATAASRSARSCA